MDLWSIVTHIFAYSMSEGDNNWRWDFFLQIGNDIDLNPKPVRFPLAKTALRLADALTDDGFVTGSADRIEKYVAMISNIAPYLDPREDALKCAVELYFLKQHFKSGLDEDLFQILFTQKEVGAHEGIICDVSDGTRQTRYYVKTHQYGPTAQYSRSLLSPDCKEIFMYQLLQNLGVGPEVHFITPKLGSKKSLYIATKECHLTLLKDLTEETANSKALVQLDLICGIFYLCDCIKNEHNCGQVDGKPMIVDFMIPELSQYVRKDIVDGFTTGSMHIDSNDSKLMERALRMDMMQKLEIVKDSLKEWNLLDTIDKTVLEVRRILLKVQVVDKLQQYVQDVKTTIELLSKDAMTSLEAR
ncbi:hypothetical protein HDU96_005629 [Phlyctochytrium bullatum]|nr:hypothetical protein HDU96_005629 [Phlyctochytrium bullatum]